LSWRSNGGKAYISTVMLVPMRTPEPTVAEPAHRLARASVLIEQVTGVLDQSLAWLGEIGAFAKPL
jgi:hypothetical protein